MYVIDVASLEEAAQDLIFARVVTKLREHLEKRDLGVNHVIVFVDELNKYAPNDGQDTYVRKMLLDLAERGRYLGLVLFSAQQFRSQVHRRVVGNSGTALYGRMDADELATPGYAVLSPAVKTKLATLEKGQLMVRHPHFTQPIFVRFPRPAIMRGRDGAEQFPQAVDVDLDAAVLRSLRTLDPSLTLGWVQNAIGIREDEDVIRARNATLRERPADVKKFFLAQLRPVVAPQAAASRPRRPPSVRRRADDPVRILAARCASLRVVDHRCVGLLGAVGRWRGAQTVAADQAAHGDTLRMRLDQESEITGVRKTNAGESSAMVLTTMKMFSRAIVESNTDKGTVVLAVTDSVLLTTSDEHSRGAASIAEAQMRGQRARFRVTPDGTVGMVDDGDATREVAQVVSLMPATFPKGAIKVGESWIREMPLPAGLAARRAALGQAARHVSPRLGDARGRLGVRLDARRDAAGDRSGLGVEARCSSKGW